MSDETRILVVERDDGLRQWLVSGLGGAGYRASGEQDGDVALEHLAADGADVVICDLFLPGLNGVEVLKRAKEQDPALEVILTLSSAPTQTVVNAMRAGAFDCMEKPIDLAHLNIVVARAVEKVQLARENAALRRITRMRRGDKPAMLHSSQEMEEVLKIIDLVAPTDLTVLIEGESGVGKELVANLIHEKSGRARMPLVAINCGVLQESLLESELFGHMKGSFTGAVSDHPGLFEVADRGTLFLDEVGEMSLDLQVKFLRVLESNEFRRVGGRKTIKVDVRVLCATNKNLREEVESGRFREDLYYRLNVIHVEVPPLRKRIGEIPVLVEGFLERNRLRGLPVKSFSGDAVEALKAYHWPGNVRELENLVERTLILARGTEISRSDFPAYMLDEARPLPEGAIPSPVADLDPDTPLEEVERLHIMRAFRKNAGNKVQTARKLGINVKTLYNKLKRYGIDEVELLRGE